MNPVLRSHAYKLGTQEMVDWMKWFADMTPEEGEMYQLLHEGKLDLFVENELNIDKTTRADMEDIVGKKFALGLILCVDREMHRTPKPRI